jgi:hypothetical protein
MDEVPYNYRVLTGIIALVGILGLVAIILAISNGKFSTGYTLRATFDRAGQGFYNGNDVKVRGVSVGTELPPRRRRPRPRHPAHPPGDPDPDDGDRVDRAALGVRPHVRRPRAGCR